MSEKKMSIIEKVKLFAELADGIREPINENEIKELSENIAEHGIRVYEYMQLIEKDAADLKEQSAKLAIAAKEQTNKAKSLRKYLADAMKNSGFEKMKFGRLSMAIQTRTKLVERRPPTESDLLANIDLVIPSYSWARPPNIGDKLENEELVNTEFSWNIDEIKKLPEEDRATYLETKSTLVLTTRVAKKD